RTHAYAGLLEKARVSLCRQRGGLLVPHVDHAYLLGAARRLHELHRPAHDEEQILRSLLLEALGQDFRACHFCHVVSPSGLLFVQATAAWPAWAPASWGRTFSARRAATCSAPMPSQSFSTSALCWPSSGAGLTAAVFPSKRTGQPAILKPGW